VVPDQQVPDDLHHNLTGYFWPEANEGSMRTTERSAFAPDA
jgi:hypothetical protein